MTATGKAICGWCGETKSGPGICGCCYRFDTPASVKAAEDGAPLLAAAQARCGEDQRVARRLDQLSAAETRAFSEALSRNLILDEGETQEAQ